MKSSCYGDLAAVSAPVDSLLPYHFCRAEKARLERLEKARIERMSSQVIQARMQGQMDL